MMIDRFWKWYFEPAEWYEFWKPQSGLTGGVVAGVLIGIFVLYAIQ